MIGCGPSSSVQCPSTRRRANPSRPRNLKASVTLQLSSQYIAALTPVHSCVHPPLRHATQVLQGTSTGAPVYQVLPPPLPGGTSSWSESAVINVTVSQLVLRNQKQVDTHRLCADVRPAPHRPPTDGTVYWRPSSPVEKKRTMQTRPSRSMTATSSLAIYSSSCSPAKNTTRSAPDAPHPFAGRRESAAFNCVL